MDCATVHVSHEKLFGIYFGEYSEDIFSSKGTKKDPAGEGGMLAFLRVVHSGRIMGQEAVPSREGRSFFIGAYFFNNSPRATSSAVSVPIR